VNASFVSYAWSSLNRLARLATECGVLASEKLPCRVISVGNIQAGGTGKTPLVALIAHEAAARGIRVCLLTRGYRSEWESRGGVIAPGPKSADPKSAGDEAALLHELCPAAWIGVGRDRVRQFEEAQRAAIQPFELVILDDGFQHWKIKKDIEIVAVTSDGPAEAPHRDFAETLKRANLVVWTKGEARPLCAGRPFVRVHWRIERLPGTGADIPPELPLHLVTGIASARRAREAIEASGFRISEHSRFPDHMNYNGDQVRGFLAEAKKRSLAVATTGKDWVKWRALGISPNQVLVFEPLPEFSEGKDLWLKTLWG